MLYHPFTGLTDLSFDGQIFPGYIHAFRACQQSHTHPEDFYTDPDTEGPTSDEENEDDLPQDLDLSDDSPIADSEGFARKNTRHDLPCVSVTDELGSQDIDRAYDWTSHIGRYTATPEVWEQFGLREVVIDPSPAALNTEQRKLYDLIVPQYTNELSGTSTSPLLLNVDGVAESGKTFTV
jgi:hypothetical protein